MCEIENKLLFNVSNRKKKFFMDDQQDMDQSFKKRGWRMGQTDNVKLIARNSFFVRKEKRPLI